MPDTPRPALEELLAALRELTDAELVLRLKSLAARERRATAMLVAHLAELETRDIYLREGHPSLFSYCRGVLALSEHEAFNRIEAARTARRFPVVLDLLAAGEVNLTTVRLLGPHLTPENHTAILEAARGKRKTVVEEIVARLSPRPDVPACVRKLPHANPVPVQGSTGCPLNAPSSAAAARTEVPAGSPPPERLAAPYSGTPLTGPSPAASGPPSSHARHSAGVRPLSPDRYRYQLTIGGSTLEKLRLAKDMLRQALHSQDDEAVLDRALTSLLEDLARHKFGVAEKTGAGGRRPSSTRVAVPESRHIPVRGQTGRVGARPRALRLRRGERPPLRGARLPAVPSRAAV